MPAKLSMSISARSVIFTKGWMGFPDKKKVYRPTVDGRNPANQLIWLHIYHYLHGFRTIPEHCNKIRCNMVYYNPHITIGSIIMAIYPKTTRCFVSLLRCKLLRCKLIERSAFWTLKKSAPYQHLYPNTPIHRVKRAGGQSSKTPWQDPTCT